MPFLADFTRAVFLDVITLLGFLVPVFLGLFALGTVFLGRK
jgi:hypothetical protein